MNQVALLQRIKELYQKKDINIIEYLKKQDGHAQTSRQDIMISYDFQAGSYVNAYKKAPDKVWTFVQRLASCIEELPGEKQSIFEPGIGEATTFAALMAQISIPFVFSGGGRCILVENKNSTAICGRDAPCFRDAKQFSAR